MLAVADVVAEMAAELGAELGAEPAQVALARTLTNPAVASPVIGARTLAQAERNLICWVGSGACPSGGCSRR
ncbi:aldo/keto reductase [Streptomyces adelaidensis]|uniref:aldo/keto reductase n=1 Tax=Streptomyces adelaidensis TaxID=2796465 RepID=UPI001F1D7254|nr:aldo/keto reductase [Streptomyces adelaidensis]